MTRQTTAASRDVSLAPYTEREIQVVLASREFSLMPICAWYQPKRRGVLLRAKQFLWLESRECLRLWAGTTLLFLHRRTKVATPLVRKQQRTETFSQAGKAVGLSPAGVFLPPRPLKWRGFQKGTIYDDRRHVSFLSKIDGEPEMRMDPRDEAITLIASQTQKTQLCILHYSLSLR